MDNFFASIAPLYEPLARYSVDALSQIFEDLVAHVPTHSSLVVLDAGAGTAFPSTVIFSRLNGAERTVVILLDRSRAMLSHIVCSRRLRTLRIVSDATMLPFGHKCFSIVTTFCALHCFASKESFIQESYRVLRDDGLLLIVFNDRDQLKHQLVHAYFPEFHDRDRARQCTADGIQRLLEQRGFLPVLRRRQTWIQCFNDLHSYLGFIRKRPFSGFAFYDERQFAVSLCRFQDILQNIFGSDTPIYNKGSIDWVLARKQA